ncbi:MAG: hypothetical protein J0L67_17880 [Cytophagales bacterium]|jgi:hypothetical protein|nr:hypothetical protein [Cytophagales bacterium]
MKNITGVVIGFIVGVAGFLFLFKIIILNRIAPEDELAPGIVVLASVLNGVLFAFAGSFLQKKLTK